MSRDGATFLDIEEIMQSIRQDIEQHIESEHIPSFSEIPVNTEHALFERLDNELLHLQEEKAVPYYADFGPGPSRILKLLIRKIIRCVVYPVVFLQNSFNARAFSILTILRAIVNSVFCQSELSMSRIDALEQQVGELKARLELSEAESAELRAKLKSNFNNQGE